MKKDINYINAIEPSIQEARKRRGAEVLINNFIPINWVWKLWPLILVAIGVVMIVTASKK